MAMPNDTPTPGTEAVAVQPQPEAGQSLLLRWKQLEPNVWNRKIFDSQDMDELTANVRKVGVQESLTVRLHPQGPKEGNPRYEIASGERRWRAAQKAGNCPLLPCVVKSLSDEAVAEMNITANIQRSDTAPLELARQIKEYKVQFNKSQKEAAERFGKREDWVSEYLGYLDFPEEAKEKFAAANFSRDTLRVLKQLPPPSQLEIAKELGDGSLKPKNVPKRCNQMRFSSRHPGESRGPAASKPLDAGLQSAGMTSTPDPLADFWDEARSKNEYLGMNCANWGVSYGLIRHSGGSRNPEALDPGFHRGDGLSGWNFWFAAVGPVPKADLKKWFLAMADAMEDTQEEEDRFHKVLEAVVPKDISDLNKMEQKGNDARIPETPEEMAKLEKLAAESASPGPVYNALLGSDSVLARQMSSLTWEAMGIKDRVAGCRQIVEGMRQMRDMRAQDSPKNPAPETPKKPRDPKLQAMIDRQLAKGRIIR